MSRRRRYRRRSRDDWDDDDYEYDDDDDDWDEPPGNWFTSLLFRPRVLFVLAAVATSAVFIPAVVKSLPDLRQRNEYQLRTADIRVVDPPPYVPSDFVAQVSQRAGLPEEVSLLDEGLNENIAAAFKRHPWVLRVVRVQKTIGGGIEVELEFREPVAMIEVRQGLYPVDIYGTLLPPGDFTPDTAKRYPLVTGVATVPEGPAGTVWSDVAVTAGADLAYELSEFWESLGLLAIHITGQTKADATIDDLTLELSTKGGSRIVWGRAPSSRHPGELPASQKIARMEKYLKDFGSFDQPHGPYEIHIHHWQEISRRPLSALIQRSRN